MTTRTPVDPRTGDDAKLAGSTVARRLYREVVTDPDRARLVDVVGPGGFGKSVLLEAVAAAYRDRGVRVSRAAPAPGEPPEPEVAFVVDDVHLLPARDLERLAAAAADPAARVVVARRPWPNPPGLGELAGVLAADAPGGPTALDVLDLSGVAARASLLFGQRAAAELVAGVAAQTAGIPVLVDRLLGAIGPGEVAPSDGVPAALIAQMEYPMAALDGGMRELLLARALDAPADTDILGPLLDLPALAVGELIEQVRATGLLAPDCQAVPLVSAVVLARTPASRRFEVRRELAELELARGGSVLAAARGLLGTGASGSRIAAVFVAGADEAVRVGSPAAGELYEAAVRAGVPVLELAARRAEAALLADDPDTALDQADQVLSAADRVPPADAVQAGTVAAAVLARRGLLGRSAELYRWMSTIDAGRATVAAVPALIGIGALGEARGLLGAPTPGTAPPARPPTLLAGAEELMARGVYDSVTGSPTAALSQLARAAALLEASHRAALLPDTPAALTALVAVHCGELDVAQSVLERAVRTGLGGRGAATRHRLLLGWIALFRGATSTARASVVAAGRLEPRDELLAVSLEVALARRAGDLGSLMPAWGRAREAIVHHPVDLFVLQQLGELSVAATRLGETSWVRPHLDEAEALLERLGSPALWAAPLHWSGLQAAILVEDRDAAQRHADALASGATVSRYAAAMATAAPHWVRLLAADVDADAVEAAARGLHAAGMSWEGGRLAGQAAIRTHDRKDMSALLGCARALQASAGQSNGTPSRPEPEHGPVSSGAAPSSPAAPAEETGDGVLSEREREVGALVLEGLTYKQIGERLFISAKTVEHHVARMRQRLNAGSRGELMAHLRGIVGSRSEA